MVGGRPWRERVGEGSEVGGIADACAGWIPGNGRVGSGRVRWVAPGLGGVGVGVRLGVGVGVEVDAGVVFRSTVSLYFGTDAYPVCEYHLHMFIRGGSRGSALGRS